MYVSTVRYVHFWCKHFLLIILMCALLLYIIINTMYVCMYVCTIMTVKSTWIYGHLVLNMEIHTYA